MSTAEGIYLLDAKTNSLTTLAFRTMREGLFDKELEEALHDLLKNHPNLIPGEQIEPLSDQEPPRFALLCSEAGLGGNSLDLLFADQYGVPALIEVKLVDNREARRAVVGQIVEYAATAHELWGGGKLRQLAGAYHAKRGADINDVLKTSLATSDDAAVFDVESFWSNVEANLDKGEIRLIIAADELRQEVRRSINYLNQEMQRATVLGLELKCYGSDKDKLVLVPTIIGQIQPKADAKSTSTLVEHWSVERLQSEFSTVDSAVRRMRLKELLDWAVGSRCFKEVNAKNPGFSILNAKAQRVFNFYFDGTGYIGVGKGYMTAEDGERLLRNVQRLGLMDASLVISGIRDGRNIKRSVEELTGDEFEDLKRVIRETCGA